MNGFVARGSQCALVAFLFGACWPSSARAASADLAITITHSPTPGVGLTQLIYTIHVSNAGPDPATSITVLNTLPPDSAFDSAGGPGWDCDNPVARVLRCTYSTLASGAAASFLGIAVIPAAQGGTSSDVATVSATESDPVVANNTATDAVLVNAAPSFKFYTLTPCRIVDTRDAPAPTGGPALAANTTRSFEIADACGVPADASAVAVNVTVVGPTDVGDLRVYPEGVAAPSASTINFTSGQVRANSATVPLIPAQRGGPGTSNQISVQCDMLPGSTGAVQLLLDVSGYYR